MKTYTVTFDPATMENYGIKTPDQQAQRTQLWLLGMSEALAVVSPDVKLTVVTGSRYWVQFRCNHDGLVGMIRTRLEGYGSTVKEG